MDTQLTYLILIPWSACKTKTNPKIQLHKAINHWKNVGKPLKSFRRQLKVIELVRDSCGWHNLPPGWDKVNWVGEKQQQYCVSPAQLRPRDGGSKVIGTIYSVPPWIVSPSGDAIKSNVPGHYLRKYGISLVIKFSCTPDTCSGKKVSAGKKMPTCNNLALIMAILYWLRLWFFPIWV